jgi:RNA polymerase sigma-70 factor, ECF subfamily
VEECGHIVGARKGELLTQPLEFPKCHKVLPQPKLASRKSEDLRKKGPVLIAAMTDAEVIKRAQAGDVSCFEALYLRHRRRVFSLCLRMLGDYALAEDFTQEAFLQLYRKIGTFRGESALSTWLHRLSVNIVLMHFRRRGLMEVPLEETLDPQQPEDRQRDIGRRDDVLYGSVDRIALERALADLAPGYRIIFILHGIEGYEHNEIAEILGCSVGNSKSQLHKSRIRLRTLLSVGDRKAPASGLYRGEVAGAVNQLAA